MAESGFFTLTGDRCQMTIPERLSVEVINGALIRLIETEDADGTLHPEKALRVLPYHDTISWQNRLQKMDSSQRVADRNTLLEETTVVSG